MKSVTEESEVGINHKVDHFISGRTFEAITEPIDCHFSRCHGVKHEPLEFKQIVVVDQFVCHVDIIGTGQDALGVLLCHLGRWLVRLIS